MTTATPMPDAPPRADAAESVVPCRYGPGGWLLAITGAPGRAAARRTRRLAQHLAAHPPEGLREVIPAFDRILLDFADAADAARFGHDWTEIRRRLPIDVAGGEEDLPDPGRAVVEIPVHFDGPDLGRVAQHAGCPEEEVVEAFCAGHYPVQCLGFSPGFPYLAGLPHRLQVPRRATPRTRVPAGSIAIGGEHAGIYPQASPGGWNLLGRTEATLFDPTGTSLQSIFRLHPGDHVRFLRCAHPHGPVPAQVGRAVGVAGGRPALGVRSIGGGVRLQDLGRPGYRRFGVPAGGSMDPAAAMAANRVLDNAPHVPVLELCGRGQVLEALEDLWIGVTGHPLAGSRAARTQRLRAGECLRVPGGPWTGVWSYIAIPGGFVAPRFLGSHGALAHAGPGAGLRVGDALARAIEPSTGWPPAIAGRFLPANATDTRPIRIWPGPQWDLFPESDRGRFLAEAWTVSHQSDRTGYRLQGATLGMPAGLRASEPVLPGSIQVPPEGLPIVTMPDGPTLGGYAKLGLVDPEDLPRVAQTPPGHVLRFCRHDA